MSLQAPNKTNQIKRKQLINNLDKWEKLIFDIKASLINTSNEDFEANYHPVFEIINNAATAYIGYLPGWAEMAGLKNGI